MIDLNSSSLFSDRINFFIDRDIDRNAEAPRRYMGVSAIGAPCERQAYYEALVTMGEIPPEEFPARVRRVFQRGHHGEDWCAAWLRGAGFVLNTESGNGQFAVSFLDGWLSGHVDGILTFWLGDEACPVELPALWECKCLNSKGWRGLQKDGVRKAYPKYYAQVNLYMMGLNLKRCLFTALNADSMELHHELVEYDEDEAMRMLRRAEHIRNAIALGETVPRGSSTDTDLKCRFCNFAGRCWRYAV